MSSVLLALQEELAERLVDDAFFAAVPVLTERERNLNFEVQQQVDSLGVACVVMTPAAGVRHAEAPGPYLDEVTVTVRVRENAALNGGPAALEVAERVAALLHHYAPRAMQEILFAARQTIRRVEDAELLVYDVQFETRDGLVGEEGL